MNDEMFEELLESVRQGGAILRGEAPPARVFVAEPVDVKATRRKLRFTQVQFAALLGISVKTLHNWEQGRRKPEGPARVLLQVAARHPEAVFDAVRQKTSFKFESQ